MSAIDISWDDPKIPRWRIKYIEAFLGSNGAFVSLAQVPPAGEQTLTKQLEPGNYVIRLVVNDTAGLKSANVDTPIVIPAVPLIAPAAVQNLKVRVY